MKYDSLQALLDALNLRGPGWVVQNKLDYEEEVANPKYNPKLVGTSEAQPPTIKQVSPTKKIWIINNPTIPNQQPMRVVIDTQKVTQEPGTPDPANVNAPVSAGSEKDVYLISSDLSGTIVQPSTTTTGTSNATDWIIDPDDGTQEIQVRLVNGQLQYVPGPNGGAVRRPAQKTQGAQPTAPDWVLDPANPEQEIYARTSPDGVLIPVMTKGGTPVVRAKAKAGADTGTSLQTDYIDDPSDGTMQIQVRLVNGKQEPVVSTIDGLVVRRKKPATPGESSQPDWFDHPTDTGLQVLRRLENGVLVDVKDAQGNPVTKKRDEPVSVVGTDPNSPNTNVIDKTGKVIATYPNNNYRAPSKTNVTPDTSAPFVVTMDPQTGALTFTPNQNSQTVDENMQELAAGLGLKVKAGSMTMKQAQDLLTTAVAAINTRIAQQRANTEEVQAANQATATAASAANTALDTTSKNAATGAGIIQSRVSAATGLVNELSGLPAKLAQSSAGRFGQLGGGITSASLPSDLGANLVQGSLGFTAQAAGGQDVLDAAARMVQQADPQGNLYSPLNQAATGTLKQILDRWQQTTGQPHPIVQAQQAIRQSAQSGSFNNPGAGLSMAGIGAGMQGLMGNGAAAMGEGAPGTDPSRATFRSPAWNEITGAQDPNSLARAGLRGGGSININIGGAAA